jgi:hypothetical protein
MSNGTYLDYLRQGLTFSLEKREQVSTETQKSVHEKVLEDCLIEAENKVREQFVLDMNLECVAKLN